MRKWFFAVCAVALMISGCVTIPPSDAVISSALPKIHGPESGYTGAGDIGAHDWTDDQARTALHERSLEFRLEVLTQVARVDFRSLLQDPPPRHSR